MYGFVSVVVFENRKSVAVSTKVYKTEKGAEAANARLLELCGRECERCDLPWTSTNIATGEKVVHYRRENTVAPK